MKEEENDNASKKSGFQEPLNLLFVCSMNQWRSPTAESIYSRRALISARSRGTSQSARRTISSADLKWASIVFVMEDKHKERLLEQFPGEMKFKELHVLHIPDEYKYMDPELIDEITSTVDEILSGRIDPTSRVHEE